MKKNILKATLVAAIALVASVNVYNAQQSGVEMSDLALANVEALASDELFDGHTCEGTWYKECCVCGYKHYTYARPLPTSGCEHRTNCSHY